MSWMSYIDRLTSPTGGKSPIEDAAIWSQEPLEELASSSGLKVIKADELRKLLGDRAAVQQGMTIAGLKYKLLRDNLDEEKVHMLHLKSGLDAQGRSYYINIGRTKTLLVIAKVLVSQQGEMAPPILSQTMSFFFENDM